MREGEGGSHRGLTDCSPCWAAAASDLGFLGAQTCHLQGSDPMQGHRGHGRSREEAPSPAGKERGELFAPKPTTWLFKKFNFFFYSKTSSEVDLHSPLLSPKGSKLSSMSLDSGRGTRWGHFPLQASPSSRGWAPSHLLGEAWLLRRRLGTRLGSGSVERRGEKREARERRDRLGYGSWSHSVLTPSGGWMTLIRWRRSRLASAFRASLLAWALGALLSFRGLCSAFGGSAPLSWPWVSSEESEPLSLLL